MTRKSPPPSARRTELARFLRQRLELGGPELFLEMSSDELLSRLDDVFRAGDGIASPVREGEGEGGGAAEGGGGGPGAAGAAGAAGVEAGGPGAAEVESGDGLQLPERHEALRKVALACERCTLSRERSHVVFADGNPDARLMVVGEAPGANEDRTGLPFVGQAGKLLDLLLATVGLSRAESVYICNVIKCRPPGNRNPRPEEIEACAPFLRRQIEIVSPEAILAVGTFAGQLLTGQKASLGKLRGKEYRYGALPLIVTYHPAALLRNSGWTRATWDDLQRIRRILDGE